MNDRRWISCLDGCSLTNCIPPIALFCVLVFPPAKLQAQRNSLNHVTEHVYVNPVMWPGVLILQSGSGTPLADADLKLLTTSLSDKSKRVLLVIEPSTHSSSELSALLKDRDAQVLICDPADFCSKLNDADLIATWAECDTVWIDSPDSFANAIGKLDATAYSRLSNCLAQVLDSGGFVRLTGDLTWLGSDAAKHRTMLLENCMVVSSQVETIASGSLMRVHLPEGARCAFAKRQLINIASGPVIEVALEPTDHYREPLKKVLREGQSIDWVQWQRTVLERQSPMYPSPDRVEHNLVGGSLVIGGGGGMPEEVWKRFVELAGGENARIVILPTAIEDPKAESSFEARVLKQAGAEYVVTLPQILRGEVEDAAFLAELDRATGVWFGGGRQWRFVDAYWGTPAWEKLRDVCRRGGVIGGSSAGATIQGDLLVRGAPAGNHIMIADGYRRGLGLLPGVAIDQHFSQRNRFKDLESCLAEFPAILGVGIDEQTALVVTSPDKCAVLGTGSVWQYPSYDANETLKTDSKTRSAMRKEYKSGSEFSLAPK